MSVKKALATLPLVLNSCGGGDGDSGPDYTPNEPGKGIWEGGFSAQPLCTTCGSSGAIPPDELSKIESIGLALYTNSTYAPNKTPVFFYNEDDDILFANAIPGIVPSTNQLIYAPDIYQNGNNIRSVSFDGKAVISSRIDGRYLDGVVEVHFGVNFDQKYFQAANLSQFNGQWTYTSSVGVWTLDFDCPTCSTAGVFSISTDGSSSCTGLGGLSLIGTGSKNEYDLSISLSSCGNSDFDGGYYGVASVLDGISANNTIVMGFTSGNGNHGFFLKPVKN